MNLTRAALTLAVLGLAQLAAAASPTITLNFKDTEIREVAASIGEITGKNFILDPRVKGKVTVVSARPISLEAVYPVFLSVLQVNGYSALPAGSMVKIVPVIDASRTPGRAVDGGGAPKDEVVTQVLELKNASANQMLNALRPLLGLNAHIAPVPGANVLVIADTQASIDRVASIIERVDQASEGDVELVPLTHASAGDIVRVLTALAAAQPKDAGTPQPAIVADERTNSVLIGGGRGDRIRLKALVAHLDTPRDVGGNTQVVYLRYAKAENLAKILQGYSSASKGYGGGAAAPSAGAGGGAAAAPLEGVSVLADSETNSLIVTAAPTQMLSVKNIIDKLDIRRAQVLVEAIIVEMSAERAAEMGITWAVDASASNGAAGFTNFPRVGPGLIQVGGAAEGGAQALNLIPDGMTVGIGRINAGGVSFAALARALAGDGDTNILSTPSLMTLDNEEAEFSAGQEVPFLTGQYTNTGTGGGTTPTNPFQTIERKDIGVKLKIKPQINDDDAVFLNIQQEVSSLATSAVSTVDAVTNKRTISTRVLAKDGEIIVLGGLTDDQVQISEQRVPVLGSIPGLGALFRYRKTSSVKRTLTVFLRPRIMHDSAEASRFTESKYRAILDQQTKANEKGIPMLQGVKKPQLPPVETPATSPANTAPPAAAPATAAPPIDGGGG